MQPGSSLCIFKITFYSRIIFGRIRASNTPSGTKRKRRKQQVRKKEAKGKKTEEGMATRPNFPSPIPPPIMTEQ